MPTRGLAGRAGVLWRTIDSVLGQERIRACPILVLNGSGADPDLVRALNADARLRVITVEQEGLPAALRVGRQHVHTAFFATLDDDDVLLPHALATRLEAARRDPGPDVVVTNGLRRGSEGDFPHVSDPDAVQRDPLGALVGMNWLLPGSWLCRSDAADATLFDGMPAHLECTYLALRFASDLRMQFLSEPTVIWDTTSPQSASSSPAFRLGQAAAIETLLELEMPPRLRASFERRLRYACHANAEHFLAMADLRLAWSWHLRSLRADGGWRHLPFTRKLLFPPRAR